MFMSKLDISDLPSRYSGHPRYSSTKVIEDRALDVILQKIEMILYTNKGDLVCDPDFGCDLAHYLWSTDVPVNTIKNTIMTQINRYAPELSNYGYSLDVYLYEGTYRDILMIDLKINGNNINFVFK